MFGEFADGVGDGEPGDEPELPLLPGQAGVQAIHQAFYQGQYFATADAVALLKGPWKHCTDVSQLKGTKSGVHSIL